MPFFFLSLLSPAFFCFLYYSASLSSHPIFFLPRLWGMETRWSCLPKPMMCRLSVLPVGARVLKDFQQENLTPSPMISFTLGSFILFHL